VDKNCALFAQVRNFVQRLVGTTFFRLSPFYWPGGIITICLRRGYGRRRI